MKKLLIAAALLATACNGSDSPEPAPEAILEKHDPVAEVKAHLLRTYREARAEAAPTRETLVELLGIDPSESREPPRLTSFGVVEADGLRVERLSYEAAPGMPVSANLWRPKGRGPFPAVLMTHGHVEGGKHAAAVQLRCADLARAGVLVLSIDLFGHGERKPLGHANAFELYAANSSLLALDALGLVRGLDLLASRRDVDAERLGLCGQSGGATVAIHVAAIDERVRATFANSGLHDWEGAVLLRPQCACNYAPNQLRLGTVADAAAMIKPRSFFASHGFADPYVPIESARAGGITRQRPGGHDFDVAARNAMLLFFRGELDLDAQPETSREPAFTEEQLSVFGDVGLPEDALSLSAIAARGQRALLPAEPLAGDSLREGLRDLLQLPTPAPLAKRDGTRLLLETEPGLHLEGWLTGPDEGHVVLIFDPLGGQAAAESDYARRFSSLDEPHRVLTVDLRGQGNSATREWDYLQLHVGQAANLPLLGRRVHDARGWLATARDLAESDEVVIKANGELAVVMLLLALHEPEAIRPPPVVLQDLPARISAGAEGGETAWGLPASLALSGLAELGDVTDVLAALQLDGTLRGPGVLVWSLRERDGRQVPEGSPLWAALAAAGANVNTRVPPHGD